VVDEPFDEGGGDHRVAEDFAPGLEAAIAGDDDRARVGASPGLGSNLGSNLSESDVIRTTL
jgi:hypothetical protein